MSLFTFVKVLFPHFTQIRSNKNNGRFDQRFEMINNSKKKFSVELSPNKILFTWNSDGLVRIFKVLQPSKSPNPSGGTLRSAKI